MKKILMRVKNWEEFQHYKQRTPPWLKLHKKLLDDYDFQCLHVASRALAPMLWLLASETLDGTFDGSPEYLNFRLRQPIEEIKTGIKCLIEKGFIVVVDSHASNMLAECLQDAMPETETETETETEKRKRKS